MKVIIINVSLNINDVTYFTIDRQRHSILETLWWSYPYNTKVS